MLSPIQLFPQWVPTDVLLVGVLVMVALFAAQINRQFAWVLDRVDPTTPVIVSVGAVLVAGSSMLADVAGGSMELWVVAGLLVAVVGMIRWA